jgi:hypothetical protein
VGTHASRAPSPPSTCTVPCRGLTAWASGTCSGASTRAGSEYARYESAAAGMGAHGFKYTHATDLGSATGCASPNALRNLGVLWGFILFSTGLLYLGSSGSGPRPRRAQGPHMRHVSSQPVERRRPLSDPQDNGLLRGSAQMERATLRPRIARQAEAAAAAAETTDAGVEDDKELNELWREHQTSKLKGRGIHRRTKPFHPSRRGETFGTQSHGMLAAVYTDSGGVWSHVQAAEAAAEAGAGALPDPATEKRGGAPQEAAAVPPPLQPTCRRADL